MNTERKLALIISSVFILLILGGYFALETIGEAFGTDCKKNKSWSFVEYKIIEYECLGWAGPRHYPLYLYKNGEKVTENGIKIDSCKIRFRPKTDLYLIMNLCNGTISELKPQKDKIVLQKVDSIIIFKNSYSEKNKKLNKKQIEHFISDWNRSTVSDYRDKNFYSIFYPDYQYKLSVFESGKKKDFLTFNSLIADESKWTYYITNPSEKDYMNQYWNE